MPQYPELVPMLHDVLLSSPDIIADNVDYNSQFAAYKKFAKRSADNVAVVQSDLQKLKTLIMHTDGKKKMHLGKFVEQLEKSI